MPETDYYDSTYRRERDVSYSSDDDDRYKKTTVRRYKVGSGHVERVDRTDDFESDVRRQRHGGRSSSNLLSSDRRDYLPERPRSALEVVETSRRSDRERDYYNDRNDGRIVEKRRSDFELEADAYGGGERSHRVVYEKTKEIDREVDGRRPHDRDRDRDRDSFPRAARRGGRDDQIVVETFSEDRRDDGHGGEIEHWHKETEYFEPAPPAPSPIVIRPPRHEQKIIVQQAPAPEPVIVPNPSPGVIVIREKDRPQRNEPRHDDEYFYERRERREVGPYRNDREEDLAIARFDRRGEQDGFPRHHHHRHHRRGDRRDYATDGEYSSDDDYYVKKTVIRRETSPSPSHHRLHLAEGALAGAGVGALLGSRRNQTGDLPEHRGRKVLAGAALGAIGTEVLKRAHSAYNERFGDDDDGDDRARSRSTSRHHSKLKTGLGIAAAALAVAGAAKYIQSNRVEREERNRGRSLHRYSSGEEDYPHRSLSRSAPRKSRSRSVAKVAAGTAAVAGLVHHFRSKSRGHDGKPRSHSRLRTGAEIAAAGLAGAAAKKLYDRHKDKKERERELQDCELHERGSSYDEYDGYESDRRRRRRSGSRSRSRSRSAPSPGAVRSPYPPPAGADAELGLVEYGAQPLYMHPSQADPGRHGVRNYRGGYDSAAEASDPGSRRRHRRRRRSRHDPASSEDDADASSYADTDDNDRKAKRDRSRSRLRNLAAAGAGAAAAAIGIKKYQDKKNRDERNKQDRDRDYDREQERDHDRDRHRDEYRDRDRNRRHHDGDDGAYDDYYNEHDGHGPPSPPHASGGAFYPPPPQPTPPITGSGAFMQHPNVATTDLRQTDPLYAPTDHHDYPPPPGPPPSTGAPLHSQPAVHAQEAPVNPNPAGQHVHHADEDNPIPDLNRPANNDNDHGGLKLSNAHGANKATDIVNRRLNPSTGDVEPGTQSKAVDFAPLSPQSSRTLQKHRNQTREQQPKPDTNDSSGRSLSPPANNANGRTDDSRSIVPYANRRSRHSSEPRYRRSDGLQLRLKPNASTTTSSEDEDVTEVLPDRFDSEGRPLDRRGQPIYHKARSRSSPLTSRRGDFEYDSSRNNGWHVRGQWGVAGTNAATVERMAENMRGVIDGLGRGRPSGILGAIGGLLEGFGQGNHLLEDDGARPNVDNSHRSGSDDDRKRKRRNTYHTGNERNATRSPDQRRSHDHRSTSLDSYDSYYDNGGYGRDTRKKRRSWGS
ncbi:hypothetical protein SPI_06138 [Niveomyces insectorum RCEF 264]|uniref:DUF3824 domain-containing protein n=1 Tax=Niveomyces insectorum RCEF 264 TaxID=1081102 RepID=A0A167RTY9_9HYPO|nr:hypothetical protein SPI_06138 [Niveomyces insectorum RCEF 264]